MKRVIVILPSLFVSICSLAYPTVVCDYDISPKFTATHHQIEGERYFVAYDSYSFGFVFQGIDKSGAYVPGGTLSFDYTRQQTAAFPLGVSYGRTYLMKDNLMQTINNTIPVMITDSVARANGVNNDVNLSVVVNTGVPHVDKNPVTPHSSIAELKSLANALLAAINASNETT